MKESLSLQKAQENTGNKKQIVIVEDDLLFSLQLEMQIKRLGYAIAGKVNNARDAVEIIKEKKPDLVLMDIFLADDTDGVDAISMIKDFTNVPFIYLTGNTDQQVRKRAHASKPVAYIAKPVDKLLLKKIISEILNY